MRGAALSTPSWAHVSSVNLSEQGWLSASPNVRIAPSPNFNARPSEEISLLVLHNISLPPNCFEGDAVVQFFQNQLDFDAHPWFENIRDVTVSAHFFIRRNGFIVQLVSTLNRAWHAGVSEHQGRSGCNDFSIGIELEGNDTQAFSDPQYQALLALCQALYQRHPSLNAVRGHEHIAPSRKTDPGPYFDWAHLVQNGPWGIESYPDFRV